MSGLTPPHSAALHLRDELERLLSRKTETRSYPQLGTSTKVPHLPGVEILEVTLQERDADYEAVVRFTSEERPGCTFVYTWKDVWRLILSYERAAGRDPERDGVEPETASSVAFELYVRFEERLFGGEELPDCSVSGKVIISELA